MEATADWINTEEMCEHLQICKSTLYRVRTVSGLMSEGKHFVRKNPIADRRCGHLLWSRAAVSAVFAR